MLRTVILTIKLILSKYIHETFNAKLINQLLQLIVK